MATIGKCGDIFDTLRELPTYDGPKTGRQGSVDRTNKRMAARRQSLPLKAGLMQVDNQRGIGNDPSSTKV